MLENFYNLFGLNKQLFLLINNITNYSITPYILRFVTFFFSISKFVIYYGIICIYLAIKIRYINDEKLKKEKFWQYFNTMTKIGITYAIFGFLYALMKFTFNLPRPFCSLPLTNFQTIIDTSSVRCLSSFPSAHTALAVLISYFLWPYLGRLQKLIAVVVIFSVMISRITLAMHYPADLIYSLIIIFLIIKISNFAFRLFKDNLIKSIGNIILKMFTYNDPKPK